MGILVFPVTRTRENVSSVNWHNRFFCPKFRRTNLRKYTTYFSSVICSGSSHLWLYGWLAPPDTKLSSSLWAKLFVWLHVESMPRELYSALILLVSVITHASWGRTTGRGLRVQNAKLSFRFPYIYRQCTRRILHRKWNNGPHWSVRTVWPVIPFLVGH